MEQKNPFAENENSREQNNSRDGIAPATKVQEPPVFKALLFYRQQFAWDKDLTREVEE